MSDRPFVIGLECGHGWQGRCESQEKADELLGLFMATGDSAACRECNAQRKIVGPAQPGHDFRPEHDLPCGGCGKPVVATRLCRWQDKRGARYLCSECCPYCTDPRHSVAMLRSP